MINYAGINQWEFQKIDDFLENIANNNYDKIIQFGQNEWEWYNVPRWYDLYLHCKKRGQPLHIITHASPVKYPRMFDNTIIDWWTTYWLGKTYAELSHTKIAKPINLKTATPDYKYHYVYMALKPRIHRCKLMDLLAKHDLLKFGAIAWHMDNPTYKWQHFQFKPMILDMEYSINHNQSLLPNEYYQSFAQLVSETSDYITQMTEKVATPLIIGKPFLVQSTQGYHKQFLTGMGFQLYDEIFDYSFDDEINETIRYEKLLNNFKNLTNLSFTNLRELDKKIVEKVTYNQALARKIMYDMDLYPTIALEVIEYHAQTNIEIDASLIRTHHLLQKFKSNQLFQ